MKEALAAIAMFAPSFPVVRPLICNRPEGVMVWHRQGEVHLLHFPVVEPTFTPPQYVRELYSVGVTPLAWYWGGVFVNPIIPDSDACAVRINLEPGDRLTLLLHVPGSDPLLQTVMDGWVFSAPDWNRDGAVTSSDIAAFFADYWRVEQDTEQPGDWDGDGDADSSDIAAYLTAWSAVVGEVR